MEFHNGKVLFVRFAAKTYKIFVGTNKLLGKANLNQVFKLTNCYVKQFGWF